MLTIANIDTFISDQLDAWTTAADNYAALSGIKVKTVELPGMTCKVQYNPARAVSSGAKVDAAAIKARKCFLCSANRPPEQFGIDLDGKYTVLLNPFPIFPKHLTIPATHHTDQLIKGRMADMARLALQLPGFTVFYNGPRCGASAPDHMHFQAGNSDFLTIGKALEDATHRVIYTDGDATLSLVSALPLPVFVIDAPDPNSTELLFDMLYDALPVPSGELEPMMNVLCYTTSVGIRTVVIPRKKHRPSFYGTEGDGCMMLSPASVDMGGVFITPRLDDFNKLDADIIKQTFNELCLGTEEAEDIAYKITNKQ